MGSVKIKAVRETDGIIPYHLAYAFSFVMIEAMIYVKAFNIVTYLSLP